MSEEDDMRVLVTAASKHGSTAEIADALGRSLVHHGIAAEVVPPHGDIDVLDFDAFVIGSAVYAGRWRKEAKEFVERNASFLRTRPVWLFSSGPCGSPLKPEDDPVDAAAMVEATAARAHRVFPGKIDRARLSLSERAVVKAVGGAGYYGDYRDWDELNAWATDIAELLLEERPVRI